MVTGLAVVTSLFGVVSLSCLVSLWLAIFACAFAGHCGLINCRSNCRINTYGSQKGQFSLVGKTFLRAYQMCPVRMTGAYIFIAPSL
jgi:hypothetical protein